MKLLTLLVFDTFEKINFCPVSMDFAKVFKLERINLGILFLF